MAVMPTFRKKTSGKFRSWFLSPCKADRPGENGLHPQGAEPRPHKLGSAERWRPLSTHSGHCRSRAEVIQTHRLWEGRHDRAIDAGGDCAGERVSEWQ